MPDAWEKQHQLNPQDPSDGNLATTSGYTWLELYLHSLVTPVQDSLSSVPVMETGGRIMPVEWIDRDTHHRVIRLTRREGNNLSFYFHNNPFLPALAGGNVAQKPSL
jgi:hypothetical protein